MFDDSTFNDDSQGHINHHDNSIPKIVSKRSVSDNSNYEPSWWERIKRSVKSMFGYEEEQHPIMEEQKSLSPSETLPVLVNDRINEKISQRKSRQTDDNDDEDEDDDDNEIASGYGHLDNPSENWGDRDVSAPPAPKSEEASPPLPDVPDSKYCRF
jgi:hypothetical protein